MTITATRLQQFHSGSTAAQTRAFTSVTLTAGRRYAVVTHALRNGSGDWAPTTQLAVTDNATAPSGWATVIASADPGSTVGTSNRSSCVIAITDTITATQTGRTVTLDPQIASSTQFINVWALYELATDSGNEIELVQVAGDNGDSANKPDLDWPATPAGFQLVAWATIHNSTLTFPTEPGGYTADYTNVTGTCGIEIQTADGVTTDPVSFAPSVSGTQFSFHVAAIELSDQPASDDITGTGASTASAATAAGTGTTTVTGTGATTSPAATAAATGTTTVAGAGSATAPPATLSSTAATTVAATGTSSAPPATTSATGQTTATATAATTSPAATTTATGTTTVTATGASTAPPATTAGTGTTDPSTTTGTGAATAPAAVAAGAGTVAVTGAGASSAPPSVTAGSGTVLVTGTAAAQAPPATATGSATTTGAAGPVHIDVAHDARPARRHHVEQLARHHVELLGRRHAARPDHLSSPSVRDIESGTIEKIPVVVTTSADPTDTNPEFAVTTTGGDPTTWVEGEWDPVPWSPTNGRIRALSPLVGDGQALDVTDGTTYDLWIRWTVGTETPVRLVDRFRIT